MPQFFFHIRNANSFDKDLEGAEFETLAKAHEEAIHAARELLAAKVLRGLALDGSRFEITSEDGVVVDIVPFKSAISLD